MDFKILLIIFTFCTNMVPASKKYKRKKIKVEYEYLPQVAMVNEYKYHTCH